MKESSQLLVDWEEQDLETFLRFGDFVYTGDYDNAYLHELVVFGELSEDDSDSSNEYLPKKTSRSKRPSASSRLSPNNKLWYRFQALYAAYEKLDFSNEPLEDHTDDLLSHAKVYVLADCYGIQDLQIVALRKLHRALSNFELHSDQVSDIAELLRYSFGNTMESPWGRDCLRELVATYASCFLDHFFKDEDETFHVLMTEFPDVGPYWVTELLQRSRY